MSEDNGIVQEEKKMTKGKVAFWVIVISVLVLLTRVILPCAGVRIALDLFIPDVGGGRRGFPEV